jgi:catechol 2,3-dioxygenase-like lactoylglutathione lyase family enzyme
MAQSEKSVEGRLSRANPEREATMSMTSPVVGTPSPFASWKFEHVALRVLDLDTAVAWYSEKLDFRLMKSVPLGDKMYGFMTSPAGDDSFIVELIAGPGADNRPVYEDLGSSLKLSGLHHVAFRVASVDDTIAELESRGVTIVSKPHDVPKLSLRLAFFADPWGNLFEVIQPISL